MSVSNRLILARNWLEFARSDFQSAQALNYSDTPLRNVCFLSQQSVEKGIKALMIFYDIPIIKTHDLDVLLLRLPDIVRKDFNGFDLSWLSEWSVEARYPGDWPEATKEDALMALEMAKAVLESVKGIIDNTY